MQADTILTAAAPQKSLLLPFLTFQNSLKRKLTIAGKPPHVYSNKPVPLLPHLPTSLSFWPFKENFLILRQGHSTG